MCIRLCTNKKSIAVNKIALAVFLCCAIRYDLVLAERKEEKIPHVIEIEE